MKTARKTALELAAELLPRWETLTWRQCTPLFQQYLREYADAEFIYPGYPGGIVLDSPLWSPVTCGIEVSCSPGSNDGYYVTIRQVRTHQDTSVCVLGKFWTRHLAEVCVSFFSSFFAGEKRREMTTTQQAEPTPHEPSIPE